MLVSGIINELICSSSDTVVVAFFFCQATDLRLSHAIAVLRGLIFMLIDKRPSLISHVRKEYDKSGKSLFEDVNAWAALAKIFTNILDDPLLQDPYLIIDGLDECNTGVGLLIDLITENTSTYPHIKWVVSSRNWPDIEERLDVATQKVTLWLEVNEESVAQAVTLFIRYKVQKLKALKRYKDEVCDTVTQYLASNAHGTFLWVALVCEELAKAKPWDTRHQLTAFPAGLHCLYERMILRLLQEKDVQLYQRILGILLAAYRPMSLDELPGLVDMPNTDEDELLEGIVRTCGSFLTIRGRDIFFVHQSAKDFLLKDASNVIIPRGIGAEHYIIFRRSLKILQVLRRDMYSLKLPGFPIDQVKKPSPDPLAAIQYSCIYWVNHLEDWCASGNTDCAYLEEGELIEEFFKQRFLHWVEAMSLLGRISEAITAMIQLDDLLHVSELLEGIIASTTLTLI